MSVCYFHNKDLDGCCSGALIKQAFPECEMIGVDYPIPFPWGTVKSTKETAFMVDFSLEPFTQMIELASKSHLIWIDHHKTAIHNSVDSGFNCDGIRYVGKGACELVWEYLQLIGKVSGEIPTAVRLIGQYDVFNLEDPLTLPFQYGVRSQTLDFSPTNQRFWDQVINGGAGYIGHTVSAGKSILSYVKASAVKYIQSAGFQFHWQGFNCLALNKNMASDLALFGDLWKEYEVLLTFGYEHGRWNVVLYSHPTGPDVTPLVKRYGGGGHEHAAGFNMKEFPPFLLS